MVGCLYGTKSGEVKAPVLQKNEGYDEIIVVGNNALMAGSSHTVFSFKSLGVLVSDDIKEDMKREYPVLYKLIQCESSWNMGARGKAGEIGWCQFMPSTWKLWNKRRGLNLDIYSEKDQINMLLWAYNNGLMRNWTCWKGHY